MIVGSHFEEVIDPPHNDVKNITLGVNNQVADEATELPPSDENKVNEAEQASSIFGCFLCDYKSNWEKGLHIHLTRKHGEME